MTSDPFDPFEPKEQTKASAARSSAFSPRQVRKPGPATAVVRTPSPTDVQPAPTEAQRTEPVAASPEARPHTKKVPAAQRSAQAGRPPFRELLGELLEGPGGIFVRFGAAFGVAAVAALFLLVAVAMGVSSSNSDRILAGVHVGGVDLGGYTRDEAVAKLQAAYAYLSEGEVTIATPLGSATITYAQAGRSPDAEAMADAALAVGHTGDAVADTAAALRSASGGQDIPIIVRVDPQALSARIR
jgi:hypothetical protein